MKEENKKKNEELQSRRQFFKKAGKAALPILGAIALANVPMIGKASNGTSDCNWGCGRGCSGSCQGGCTGSCYANCKGSCAGMCKGSSFSR